MSKFLFIIIAVALILCSCGDSVNLNDATNINTAINDENQSCEAKSYISIDDIIFLGESTTYHLKSRGVLTNGTETTQVWAPRSGTLMLDNTTSDCRIIYPENGKETALCTALELKKPKYIMLTFGLNGATNFIKRGEAYFKYCYQKLTDEIKRASPNTKIIINSCFPIAESMDMKSYTIDASELNSYINTINLWASNFANENQFQYINTASAIKNETGFLDEGLQVGDGYHLNASAYYKILDVIKNTEANGE